MLRRAILFLVLLAAGIAPAHAQSPKLSEIEALQARDIQLFRIGWKLATTGGIGPHPAISDDQEWDPALACFLLQQPGRLGILGDIDLVVGDIMVVEETSCTGAVWTPGGAIEQYRGVLGQFILLAVPPAGSYHG